MISSSHHVHPGTGLKRRFALHGIDWINSEDDPQLQATHQMIFGSSAQDMLHNQSDLSFLIEDCKSTRQKRCVPLVPPDTMRSGFSFSEVTSVFRPTKRAASHGYGQMAFRGMPSSIAINSEQPSNYEINESVDIYNKLHPSVKLDVAVVPQKEWDQLFEMALKAASWRIATTDIQKTSYTY
jgi:hypothetical protein